MTGFTPGPWRWAPDFHEIQDQTGDYAIAVITACGWRYEGSLVTPDLDEAFANARLIQAAPDLLACVKTFLRADELTGFDLGVWTEAARDLIARAEGVQP